MSPHNPICGWGCDTLSFLRCSSASALVVDMKHHSLAIAYFPSVQYWETAKFGDFSSDLPRYSRATESRGRETIGSDGNKNPGAEEGTRTPTPLRVHGPEPCASANSATSAKSVRGNSQLPFRKGLQVIFYRGGPGCQTMPPDFHRPVSLSGGAICDGQSVQPAARSKSALAHPGP